jgi:hypothetical protein
VRFQVKTVGNAFHIVDLVTGRPRCCSQGCESFR